MREDKQYILELKNITKRFPGIVALNRVNLKLEAGKVHVLLGENGAGKSTLIKVMTGAYIPEEGEIFVNGKKVVIDCTLKAQELGIGAVYQEFNLMPHLTVAENIFMGKEPIKNKLLQTKDVPKMIRDSKHYLSMLGAKIDPAVPVKSLGVAMQQMVEISKALAAHSKILILDEPTAVLTEEEIKKLMQVIKRLTEQKVAIVYISHRLEEIQEIGDTITVLRDGNYVDTLSVDRDNFDVNHLIHLMIGRSLNNQYPKEKVTIGSELLRVEHLYKKGKAEDISFTLYKGEILGLAGLVGAGRTETAKLIFGADRLEHGKIFIEGKEVVINSPLEAIKNNIGLAPEDRKTEGLLQGMTVTDNMIVTCFEKIKRHGIRRKSLTDSFVNGLIHDLSIATPSNQQIVKYLSGGNQQKVVLAKWIASNSKILILDEPTRGIDVGAKVEVYELMGELVKKGYGILMISSELPEILAMSDRILVMYEHKLQGELTRKEATQEKILTLASGGTMV